MHNWQVFAQNDSSAKKVRYTYPMFADKCSCMYGVKEILLQNRRQGKLHQEKPTPMKRSNWFRFHESLYGVVTCDDPIVWFTHVTCDASKCKQWQLVSLLSPLSLHLDNGLDPCHRGTILLGAHCCSNVKHVKHSDFQSSTSTDSAVEVTIKFFVHLFQSREGVIEKHSCSQVQ